MYNAKLFDNTIAEMSQRIGIDTDEMYDMVIDNARDWLMDWTGDEESTKAWESTPEFWAWWRAIWMDTDLLYLGDPGMLEYIKEQGDGLINYRMWHSPSRIRARPNSVVYESFHKLVKSITQKVKSII